jgi:hypothetical protein
MFLLICASTSPPVHLGYATREWLQSELIAAGCETVSVTESSGGGPFFICQALKCAEGTGGAFAA